MVKQDWVDELCDSFVENMDQCTDANAMDIVLDWTWLTEDCRKTPMLLIDGFKVMDVPLLDFTTAGKQAIKPNNLWMLSGNHRRLAVIKYVGLLNEKLEEAKSKVDEVLKGKTLRELDKMADGAKRQLEDAKERVELLKKRIVQSSHWTVRVYDRGTWRHEVVPVSCERDALLMGRAFSCDRERGRR